MLPNVEYPPTRQDETFDVYHGVRVDDPYRWLEDSESAATREWTEAQNALTRRCLDGPARERVRAELRRLHDYPRISPPVPRGSRYFFTRNDGLQNQPVLYVHDGLGNAPRVLLDPNALSRDGTTALTEWEPSPDGDLVAYALSSGGSDWQEVVVRHVARGADLPDRLQWAKFVTISWLADSSGFYYTRFPKDGRYYPAVYAHELGTPQASDRVVVNPADDPEIVYEVGQSSDHRILAVTAYKGASEKSSIRLFRLQAGAEEPEATIGSFEDAWTFIDAHGGDVFLRTTMGAARGRIVARGAGGELRKVVPEQDDSLVDARLIGGRIAALYLHRATSRIRLFDLDGAPGGEVALPAAGSVTELTGEAAGEDVFVRFASFTWPPQVLRASVRTGAALPFGEAASHVDPAAYDLRQVWYATRDGTHVSMFLVHRPGAAPDGPRPVWLTGYGGFNVSIVPDFDPGHILWLDRGGVLAVPNLRGGGEYGEAWHAAGMRDRKQNVFDDCVAAAEWLIAEGVTRPGRIVLEGGSNGGLLVSAVLTQRPDLPGAVVCRVPVTDMLRYHLFTVGRFWIPEYGVVDEPSDFAVLYAYSPLHRVRDEVRYPPVLITTAETDDRVDPGMARKLAARLQAAQGGPALIRIERRAGHGAGKPVTKVIEEDADIYAFALAALDR